MEYARAVRACKGMRTKQVALCLDEVCAHMLAAELIQIGERVHHGRQRQPALQPGSSTGAQAVVARRKAHAEKFIQQQTGEGRITPERCGDIVQEIRLDDTACAENRGDRTQIKRPAVSLRCITHKGEALRICNDLGGIQRLTHLLGKSSTVRNGLDCRRIDQITRLLAGIQRIRHDARPCRRSNCGDIHALPQRFNARPAAGAFLRCTIRNMVDQASVCKVIRFAEDISSDADQEALQLSLVPFRKQLCKFVIRKSADIFEQQIALRNCVPF